MGETEAFETVTGGKPETPAEARNGLRHTAALSMTKIADGLIDPKLVLSWLLSALGAPTAAIGALVPIREAGALLPQVALAGPVERMRRRKWAWVAGSAGQGIAAGLIVLVALTLEGTAAGGAICAVLAALAVSRALCSLSFKEVLGATVGKTRRGAVTGFAGSASSIAVLAFALLLISGLVQNRGAVVWAIALAAALWGLAALVFSTLEEEPSSGADKAEGVNFGLLTDHPVLWRFILVRGLLVPTALAPPYLVILGGGDGGRLGQLGALVLASAAASLASSWVWGRASDVSSRKVLMAAGVLGGLAIVAAVLLFAAGLAETVWAMPAALFVLMVAYHGVRQGRSTYLVDISPEDQRAAWAAVANTVIGVILLAVGAIGGAASMLGAVAVLILFAVMSAGAAVAALWLEEAE